MSGFLIFIICIISFILGKNYLKIKKYFSKNKSHKKREDDKNENNKNNSNYSFNESDDLKMVFLVRQDLKMGAGKIAAQVAHAAIGLYDDILEEENIYQKNALNSWFNFGQKKSSIKSQWFKYNVGSCKKMQKSKVTILPY